MVSENKNSIYIKINDRGIWYMKNCKYFEAKGIDCKRQLKKNDILGNILL